MKKMTAVILLTVLLAALCLSCPASAETVDSAESKALEYLAHELEASSDHLLNTGEDVDDIYTELNWTSVADTYPTRFDLRDRGTVTPVRSQNPWGTCWSFATVAASETSILNSLSLTTDTYREKYGEDLDLSEKHLAWFTTKALPALSDYPEGEYPYNPAQAGEGLHFLEGKDTEPLNTGGNYFLSSASLASGVGILKEKYAPYTNAAGTLDKDGDWSLPEEDRYAVSYEVRNVNILPSPAAHDAQGNEIYRPAATEAIKSELLAGRAVGISFCADHSMPEQPPEEKRVALKEALKDVTVMSEEEKDRYIDIRAGLVDPADVSEEELRTLILQRLRMNDMPEDTYDLTSFSHDQLAEILLSVYFGKTYEEIAKAGQRNSYMTFIGSDPVIYAQYTYEPKESNHAVTVVGWDDTFSAESWPEDRRPPADGAWIVKNSWGTDWGNEGYFMLSYYDKSLCAIGSFEYVVSEENLKMDYLNILDYDHMPAEIISSTLFDTPVYAANVFTIEEDSVLEYVSAMTGDLDTTVTAAVYLMKEGAAGPADAILLDTVSETFRFAGYHRLPLNNNLLLPEGTRIGIVILETVPVENGQKYALVNTSSLNEKGAETFNTLNEEKGRSVSRYAKGIVNPGESYVSFESVKWIDWADAVALIGQTGANANMAYDNLPIKAYIYPWSQVQLVHDLSKRVPTVGGEAAVCPEDGYTLIDVVK